MNQQWRFLAIAAAAACGIFAAAWLWVAAVPLAYMEPEYPYWLAKRQLLAGCDLGQVLIVGDSRAAVGILPRRLGVSATNLAVGGGQAIETYFTVARALDCPVPPRLVVISIDAAHFVLPDLFWERSVRYGLIGGASLQEVLAAADRLGDRTISMPYHDDHLPPGLRAQLHDLRFPPFYFNAVLKAGLGLRWWSNNAALRRGILARGQYYFGTASGSADIAREASLTGFMPLPIQTEYFNRLLKLLSARGVAVMFVAMPVNEATRAAIRPAVERGFKAYLDNAAVQHPGFQVAGALFPTWPNKWFGDGFSHLNPAGAARFTSMFDQLLREKLRPPAPQARPEQLASQP